MDSVMVPVSVGELIDKLTILDLKAARIADAEKRAHVAREQAALSAVAAGLEVPGLAALRAALVEVNGQLWDVEDALRLLEADARFDEEFVALARSVYKLNDRRAALKREINAASGSALTEVKSYKGS